MSNSESVYAAPSVELFNKGLRRSHHPLRDSSDLDTRRGQSSWAVGKDGVARELLYLFSCEPLGSKLASDSSQFERSRRWGIIW